VDVTGSESYPVPGFGISNTELRILLSQCQWFELVS